MAPVSMNFGYTNSRNFDLITKRIPMASRVVSMTTLAFVLCGCTFIARSPNQYRDDTSNLLASKAPALNECFDNARRTTPALSGKVTVRFSVERKTGKILNAVADPSRTTAPQPLIDCVTSSINGLVLSPPDQRNGDATFEYDFTGTGQTATTPPG